MCGMPSEAVSVLFRRVPKKDYMRAVVKLRPMLESNEELNRRFAGVIRKLALHDKYFTVVLDELKRLRSQPVDARRQIGFTTRDKSK
jgi:hypothetical protein